MKKLFIIETKKLLGENVELFCFVESVRDHGKIIFFDLRDRSGILQAVIDNSSKFFELAQTIKPEFVVRVEGEIRERPAKLKNPNLETGEIELLIASIEILQKAATPPFSVTDDGRNINEELRLKYRYLDLRRPRLQQNLIMRHKVLNFMRQFLTDRGFVEIETPILTKSTPEGARDYVVPSRLYPGKFYALPQSPQQYKQLLMVAGFERYFQIARCFRDEDPRGDRQPEFTQLDIEMSFVDENDILALIEELYLTLVKNLYPNKKVLLDKDGHIPKLTYKEVMTKYQSDKPDIRQNKNNPDELAFLFVVDFPMFEWKENESRWDAVHHPFTMPKLADGSVDKDKILQALNNNPDQLLARQYDFVLNGYEIGGGSIRISDPDILQAVFETIGNKPDEIKEKFGHIFEAFSYGVPPHGGIAPGIDRLIMVLQNESSIREVIAFPKTGEGQDLMMAAPSELEEEQLKELKLKVEKSG
jgi:aspartyl-tRNA synthetase